MTSPDKQLIADEESSPDTLAANEIVPVAVEETKKKITPIEKNTIKQEKKGKMRYAIIDTNQGKIEVELWEDKTPKTVANFVKLAKDKFYEGIYFHRVIPDFMIQGGCPNTLDKDRSNDGSGGPGYKFEDECYKQGGIIKGKIESDDDAFSVFSKVILPYLQSNKDPDKEILDLARACQQAQSGEPLKAHPVEYYTAKTGFKGDVVSQGELIHTVDYGTLCMANSGPNTNGSQFFIVTKKEGASWLNGKHTVFGKVISGMDVVHKIENLPRDKSDNPLATNQAIINSITIK